MDENLIKWTKSDKTNLRKAVNNFNAKIRRLEKLGLENLPEKVSYKELVGLGELRDKDYTGKIYSRNELNNTIRSLQRFTRRGAEELVELPSGQKITAWQKREISIKKARLTRLTNKRLQEIDTTFGMGNMEIQMLKGTLNSIKNLENKIGYEFKRTLRLLESNSRSDKELKRATTWAKNWLGSLEQLESYNNVNKLKEAVSKIKNPLKLYEFISKSKILEDLLLWYHDKATSNTIAGFKDNQEAFDYALSELGII